MTSDLEKLRGEVKKITKLYEGGQKGRHTLIAVSALLKIVVDQEPSALQIALDYRQCLIDYESGEAWTLDKAFGVEGRRKGMNRVDFRFRKRNSLKIYKDVVSQCFDHPIDEACRNVAEKYNRSFENIRDTYYRIKKVVDRTDDVLLERMNIPKK